MWIWTWSYDAQMAMKNCRMRIQRVGGITRAIGDQFSALDWITHLRSHNTMWATISK
jgi:hypothetical protein